MERADEKSRLDGRRVEAGESSRFPNAAKNPRREPPYRKYRLCPSIYPSSHGRKLPRAGHAVSKFKKRAAGPGPWRQEGGEESN